MDHVASGPAEHPLTAVTGPVNHVHVGQIHFAIGTVAAKPPGPEAQHIARRDAVGHADEAACRQEGADRYILHQ